MHEFSAKLARYYLKERDVSEHSFSVKCTFVTFSAIQLPAHSLTMNTFPRTQADCSQPHLSCSW